MRLLCIILASLTSCTLFANECRLKEPYPISMSALQSKSFLAVVDVNEPPVFLRPNNYVPHRDALQLNIFNLELNKTLTPFIGANISIQGKLDSVGLSRSYSGNVELSGATIENENEQIYTTTYTHYFTGQYEEERPRHVVGEAIEQSRIVIRNGNIISILLTSPIFVIWRDAGFGTELAFTGQHQKICVKEIL